MKLYFVSLGCPKNNVDMEATVSLLSRAGHETVADPESADLLLVNACSFLESAWNETLGELETLAAIKRRGGNKTLVLMGCLPKHRRIDLRKTLPDVDIFLPPGAHGALPGMIGHRSGSASPVSRAADPFAGYEGRILLTPGHTAYVKIAEGCSHTCEFCAIPAIKGPMISRSPDSIRREVEDLVRRGVREISIIAQDPAAYNAGGCRLPDLLDSLAVTGIDWMRLLYIHPASVKMDDLARIFEIPQVCRYLDIPVQHASDRILARMKRGHRIEAVARVLEEIRRIRPDVVFRSEVITGYPGESEDDFELLKEWVESAGIATLGIFVFSPEPGTPAFDREDLVPPEVSAGRHAELVSAHEAFAFGFHSGYIGRILDVLVDRTLEASAPGGDECRSAGRYYGQSLEIDGEVFLRSGDFPPGRFVTARIVDATIHDLVGEAVEKA